MLSHHHQSDAMKERFPNFEHSYETVIHKNVPDNYNLAMAIPVGRKSFAWFTFGEQKDALYILNLDKDRKIVKTTQMGSGFTHPLSIGTILYGIVLPDTNVFIIEDIYMYQGIPMSALTVGEKLHYIHELLSGSIPGKMKFVLPKLWYGAQFDLDALHNMTFPYQVHHIQFRSLVNIVPYLNYSMARRPTVDKPNNVITETVNVVEYTPVTFDFHKPQYRQTTVFHVMADMKFDIYHLFAKNNEGTVTYYNTAFIPNYKTSVMMNGIFRNIKENRNIDYIEESEDEDDFENIREDRFVDLQKVVYMECMFNNKFKRWTPMRIVDKNRWVHISKLTR